MVLRPNYIKKAIFKGFEMSGKDLLLVVLATLVLRLPSLFEPPWYDDEGIYAAVANSLLNGQSLYTEVLDNRPPGIYFIYAAIIHLFGPNLAFIKLAAALNVVGAQLVLMQIGSRLWSRKAGIVAALLFGVLSALPLFEGTIANTEIFTMFPISLGVLLWLRGKDLYAGLAFGAALSIKQIAGVEFAAVLLTTALFAPYWRRRIGILLAGYSVPVFLMLAYVVLSGSFGEFIYANFSYYTGYLQRGSRVPPSFLILKVGLLVSSILLMMAWVRGSRSEKPSSLVLIPMWLAFSLFGSILTGRPYVHYLLPVFPAFSLLAAWYITSLRTTRVTGVTWRKLVATSSVVGISIWMLSFIFVPWPRWANLQWTMNYYKHFAALTLRLESRAAYNDFFDKRVNRNQEVASYLASRAKEGDSLLVWGDEPWIYALSSLPEVARFTVAYFAYEIPGGLKEVADSVAVREPTFIAIVSSEPVYPELKKAIEQNYLVSKTVGNITVMERTPPLIVLHGDIPPNQFTQ
ncbi:MAG: hypothetical protein EXR50_00765 [Dehalococcoidia bacterium]|nr:hypothetical protein [Dehalococcoidia bacterium]